MSVDRLDHPDPLAHLQALLREGTRSDAEGAGHVGNHLPAALSALHRLGASPARLQAYAEGHGRQLHAAPAIVPWPVGEPWRGRFGDAWAWPAYRDFFRQWLAHEGGGNVLREALPWLIEGCGAAAFHGMIRTAYAFETVVAEELADGLAYWACRWMDLGGEVAGQEGGPGSRPGPRPRPRAKVDRGTLVRNPAQLAADLAALPGSVAPSIAVRMLAAAQVRGFGPVVAHLQIDADSLPRLDRQAAQRYARSGNFTVLHLVTSAHALRVLLPLIDDAAAAVAHYWRAYAAGIVAARVLPGRVGPMLDWPQIVAAAIASEDDHLVKLVDACQQEQRAYGGAPDWQRAASRAVTDAARRRGATRGADEPVC